MKGQHTAERMEDLSTDVNCFAALWWVWYPYLQPEGRDDLKCWPGDQVPPPLGCDLPELQKGGWNEIFLLMVSTVEGIY